MEIEKLEDCIVYYLKNRENLVKGNEIPKELKSLDDVLSYLDDENPSFFNNIRSRSYYFLTILIFYGKILNTNNLLFNSFSYLYSIFDESIIIQKNNFAFNYFLDRFLIFLDYIKINYVENEENYVEKIEKFLNNEYIWITKQRWD